MMDKIIGWQLKPGPAIQGNSIDFLKLSVMTPSYSHSNVFYLNDRINKLQKKKKVE